MQATFTEVSTRTRELRFFTAKAEYNNETLEELQDNLSRLRGTLRRITGNRLQDESILQVLEEVIHVTELQDVQIGASNG